MDLLVVTKGVGFGHSIRDIQITNRIKELQPDLDIHFASYGDGVNAYRLHGIESIDLCSGETENVTDIKCNVDNVIKIVQPQYIMFDEMEEVVCCAKKNRIPSCYISNYINKQVVEKVLTDCEAYIYAEIMDQYISGLEQQKMKKVFCVGPIVQKLLPATERTGEVIPKKITIFLGGSKQRLVQMENVWLIYNIAHLLPDYKITVVGEEYEQLLGKSKWKNISWLKRNAQMKREYLDNRICITRGGINTLWEMALGGYACLAIPYSEKVNCMEQHYVRVMEQRGCVKKAMYSDLRDGSIRDIIEKMRYETEYYIKAKVNATDLQNSVKNNLDMALHYCLKNLK